MTTTIGTPGRLCNHIIRNLCINIIAQKNNLFVSYSYIEQIQELGITLFCGENTYQDLLILDDNLFLDIINNNIEVKYRLDCNFFYQTPEISKLLYNYLRNNNILNSITHNNKFKTRYNNNNDIFIHIRLGDVENLNPGLRYYITAINNIQHYDNIYIGTDTPQHQIIKELQTKYNNIAVINYNEVDTIQFASTCKYVILSSGTFSCVIGYLAYYSLVYWPEKERDKIWCGDIFECISDWHKVNYLT